MMRSKLIRTDSQNQDFQNLVKKLDTELSIRNGDQNDFFKQYNKIDHLNNVVIVKLDDKSVACGAFKPFDNESVEIKRMYTEIEFRGHKFATAVLSALESWAKELGYKKCILETGKDMTSAVNLYQRQGYVTIPNYGQYQNVVSSICMEKCL